MGSKLVNFFSKPSLASLLWPAGGGMLALTAAGLYLCNGPKHPGNVPALTRSGHSSGRVESFETGLPVFREPVSLAKETVLASLSRRDSQAETTPLMNLEGATILKAVPITPAPQTIPESGSPEIRPAIPISIQKPKPQSNYEPFKTSLNELLRLEVPPALPLPMVYQAVLMSDKEWLSDLLKSGFGVNEQTPLGDTPLCAAIKSGHGEIVEMLLLHGADPNKPGRDGQPPVALASLRRSQDVLPALLKSGADANATFVKPVPDSLTASVPFPELKYSLRKESGVTPLMAAAARGDVEATIALLQHGARANKPTTTNYRYPINFAAEQRFIFIMRLLLGRPADSEPNNLVVVDLSQQRAVLRRFGQVIDTTKVSTGREGYETPSGRYVITDKHKQWTSNVYHVQMPWFMRLNCSAIGLHSGYVTGEPASHGCIRLPPDRARKWFGLMEVGDEVQIVR